MDYDILLSELHLIQLSYKIFTNY